MFIFVFSLAAMTPSAEALSMLSGAPAALATFPPAANFLPTPNFSLAMTDQAESHESTDVPFKDLCDSRDSLCAQEERTIKREVEDNLNESFQEMPGKSKVASI